ncbi:MAG: DUF447 family protein [Methanophagales archaeon]|nr:DUF447 family protein [Methanophagales archaeon]
MKKGRLNLDEAGIVEGISEVIVTTWTAAGIPNAAPIGIIYTIIDEEAGGGKDFVNVKLYKSSQTVLNVLKTRTLAANVTNDVLLFVKSAFEHLNGAHFSVFDGLPVLLDADAWIVFTAVPVEETRNYFCFQLQPRTVRVRVRAEQKGAPRAINRGRNAVIEATIFATRYDIIAVDEREKEEIRKIIGYYAAIVKKCGGRRENEAIGILQESFRVRRKN